MRTFPYASLAVLLFAGCRRDGIDPAAPACPAGGAPVASYTAVTLSSARLGGCLTLPGDGATYLVVGEFASVGNPANAVNWEIGTSITAAPQAGASAVPPPALWTVDNAARRAFETTLRGIERTIAPRVRAEAIARITDPPPVGVVHEPPALGTKRDFKVAAAVDGSSFTQVTARLVYAGANVLLYVDTIGPGFTDAQYAALGALFDRDLYGIAIGAFGGVSDFDGNGRVITLFTPKVNALVNASDCAFSGYVTGFFYGTDLLLGDPNSNRGEIIYSYVPDPFGQYGCPHQTASVNQVVPGMFLHELQHMISFSQHVLFRGGVLEEEWLNEGLGQIAEELGSDYYEAKYPPPSGRTSTAQLFPDSAAPFIQPQLIDAYVYLGSTRGHSVTSYSGGGSLEERGATWLFLRWLASQKGEGIFGRLVQTARTGVANIEAQTGESFGALFGDFSAALAVDSIPGSPRSGVPARYRFGRRNIRALMAREATIQGWPVHWPLPVYPLGVGGALAASMIPGTMVHSSITMPAGGAGVSLDFTGPQSVPFPAALGAQVTVFRMPP